MKMSLTPLEFHELMQGAPQPATRKLPHIAAVDIYWAVMIAQGCDPEAVVAFTMQTMAARQHYINIATQLNKRLQSA